MQALKISQKHHQVNILCLENLDQTKVTGVEPVNKVQDGVHGLVAGQLGQGGLLQPVGDLVSKEGINKYEENQGIENQGKYLPKLGEDLNKK